MLTLIPVALMSLVDAYRHWQCRRRGGHRWIDTPAGLVCQHCHKREDEDDPFGTEDVSGWGRPD